MANGTSKNVGLGKFWQDLEISEAFLISLEVSFSHGLLLLFLSLETFSPKSLGLGFLTSLGVSASLGFYHSHGTIWSSAFYQMKFVEFLLSFGPIWQ